MFGLVGLLSDIKQLFLEWAVTLCVIGAIAAYVASFFTGALTKLLPWLAGWTALLRPGALALALGAAYLQGLADSSAHHRLQEAREGLRRANAQLAAQDAEMTRRERIRIENDKAVARWGEEMLANQAAAEASRTEISELERNDADVKGFLRADVPAGLRPVLGRMPRPRETPR